MMRMWRQFKRKKEDRAQERLDAAIAFSHRCNMTKLNNQYHDMVHPLLINTNSMKHLINNSGQNGSFNSSPPNSQKNASDKKKEAAICVQY